MLFKYHGPGRVGSGRVNNFSNITGKVRSGVEVMESSRVESGHDPRETGHSPVGPALPARCFLLTRGSDPGMLWVVHGSDSSNVFRFLTQRFISYYYS